MSDTLTIEGKQYISSRRAAEIAGYSNDYIGQLCRAGKLACRMVGRFWYVDEGSLIKHKKDSIKPNQTVFKKIDSDSSTPVVELTPLSPFNPPVLVPGFEIEPPPAWQWTDLQASSAQHGSFIRSPYTLVTPTLAAAIFLVVMIATGNARFQGSFVGGSAVANASTPVQSAEQAVLSIWNSALGGVSSVIARLSGHGDQVALESGNDQQEPQEPSVSSVIPPDEQGKVTAEHAGLVIAPAQDSSADDTKLEQSIQNSFSDTVVVKPNADGTTGVIQPVFKTVSGHDYLYVLVPVKASSTTTTTN